MKMKFFATLAAFMILTLTGCGSSNSKPPTVFVTTIFSDSTIDGDIQLNSLSRVLSIAQGNTESVLAGRDPINGDEYRAFLHFPLASVPVNANIESAFLDIFINTVDIQFPADTMPVRIDLVSFQPPVLIESDFDFPTRLAVSPIIFPIFLSDLRNYVTVDVTQLMIAAQRQRLQLPDFQVRIMEDDLADTPGLIEINDTTNLANRSTFAPLLTVNYF